MEDVKTFNELIYYYIDKGYDVFNAIFKAEESGLFSEEEIQEWFDKFNSRRNKSLK